MNLSGFIFSPLKPPLDLLLKEPEERLLLKREDEKEDFLNLLFRLVFLYIFFLRESL